MIGKKKKTLYIILSLFIIGLCIIGLFITKKFFNNTTPKEAPRVIEELDDTQKKLLSYDYEVPNNLNVLEIISDKKLIVEEDNELKIYNVEDRKFENKIIDISKDFKVEKVMSFNDGIVWVENRVEPKIETKIYIKRFSSDKVDLLEESNSDILPSLAMSSKYLTYYIVNDDKISVKLFNLENRQKELIAKYQLSKYPEMPQLSTPNTNDKEVIWSCSNKEKSNIFKYNIENKEITELPKTDLLYNPVIKNNRIIAIKRNDFYDKSLNTSYASDYVVEYNHNKKEWNKFLEGKIDKYIESPKESIGALSTNKGLFYWSSTFSSGKYVYNFSTDKITSLAPKEKNYFPSIRIVKDNIIYYEVLDYNDKISNYKDKMSTFIYVLK